MKPSVGRVVHYVSYGTPGGEYGRECRAAIVTAVGDPAATEPEMQDVDLCVLNPAGLFFNQGAPYSDDNRVGGSWHWPERVE